jgi:hypothetical protein
MTYDGEGLMIPPQGTLENVDREKVTTIPAGIKFIPYPVKEL